MVKEVTVRKYEKLKFLGEGQFATVYKARDTTTDQIVAIKKIKLGTRAEAKDGVNRTALREIKLLQEIHHNNIIGLLDVFGKKNNISLVFDFMDMDLEQVIKDGDILLQPQHIKNFTIQTLLGLEFLHAHWILHRDLKPNNLLLDLQGNLKIGDFGLARFFGSPNRVYTHQVVTRWYRPPELLFGARHYGTGVDMWAVGCIIAELLLRVPIFPGESDLDQLVKIFEIKGSPKPGEWDSVTSLADYIALKPCVGVGLENVFTAAGPDMLQLISALLCYDPLHRASCPQALCFAYFKNPPYPCDNADLPLIRKAEPIKLGVKRRIKEDEEEEVGPSSRKRLAF